MGSRKGRGNQYIQLVKVLYCKLPTNGKQLPAFPLEAVPGTEPRPGLLQEVVLYTCTLFSAISNFEVKNELWKPYLSFCLQNLNPLPTSLSI